MIKSCLVTFFFISFFSLVRADIIIKQNEKRVSIGKFVSYLVPDQEYSLEQAVNKKFIAYDNDVPNFGLSPYSIWLKFTITNTNKDPNLLLEIAYPILDEVELFVPKDGLGFSRILMGEKKEFTERKYKHPNYIFDLHLPTGISKTYYLRIKSSEQVILPVTINKPTALWESLNIENLITGIFVGIVVIMVLYNLFVFLSVRDRSYLYYVIYVLFVGLTQVGIKGYTFQFLWPNSSDFAMKSVVLFASVSGFAALLFTKNFLSTKRFAQRMNYALTFLMILFTIAFIVTLWGQDVLGFKIMQTSTTLSILAILISSSIVMSRGYTPAKYFFSAWLILLLAGIVFLLKDYGILPYNTFTSYSMQGASAIEMALLSFGLADRINILKKEKEQSQAELVLSAQENARIIREQNVILEAKVEERTEELSAANEEINQALIDLKEAEGQLVEAEKMASLGQLTAGIAHEINNPINFVTSNVNPLRRDIDLLFDTIEKIEGVGLSDDTDKQQQIDDYKEEIDYDYLKVEIAHLLNGIHDGASRTAEIVKGLRIFSRLDEDDLKKADLNEGLDSTLIIVNNLLNNKIVIEKHYGDIPVIDCYPGKLNQVFLNILSNAIFAVAKKFENKEGGIIKITTENKENGISIKIEDNGIGMDDLTKKKIFEPFFTTKDVGEGTGLGMSIAFNTIRRHEGEIIVNSTPGLGTEFILELPLVIKGLEIVE